MNRQEFNAAKTRSDNIIMFVQDVRRVFLFRHLNGSSYEIPNQSGMINKKSAAEKNKTKL